jgi:hypothetical protein
VGRGANSDESISALIEVKSAGYRSLSIRGCSSRPVFVSMQDSVYGEALAEVDALVMDGLEALKGVGTRSIMCGAGPTGGVAGPVVYRICRDRSVAVGSKYRGDVGLKKGFMARVGWGGIF